MKTAEKKRLVQYRTGADIPTCPNCAHFTSKRELPAWMREVNKSRSELNCPPKYTIEEHGIEINLRCTLHGFATQKLAICGSHNRKKESDQC